MLDADVASLDQSAREVVAKVWHGRANGERATAETFRVVAAGLEALGAEPELIALARRAIADEMRHAERCWQLACHYAESALPEPQPRDLLLPTYDGATEELRHTLHVVGQCCLNETTASAFLERCLQSTTATRARQLLRVQLADEVDHARIGWAHLASRPVEERRSLARWIPQMIATNTRTWSRRPEIAIEPIHAAHGVPDWPTVDEVVATALDALIIPGLRHVGISVVRE